MSPAFAAELIQTWGYPALLALLLATAFGSPIPEDLLLLTSGYLIGIGAFDWTITFPLAMIGVVGSDLALYAIGRRIRSHSVLNGRAALIRPERLRAATRWFTRVGSFIVFIARLVPGTRLVVFVTAGTRRVAVAKFLAFDLAGAFVWVPFMLFLGSQAGEEIADLRGTGEAVARAAGWLALVAVLSLLLVRAYRARRAREQPRL